MTVALSSSSHGNPVFQTLTFQDRPGENWVGSPAMQALKWWIKINWCNSLFFFSCQGDQRTPGTCFYQLEFATQEVFKFQWLETTLVAIASQVLMSKVLGSLWLQFQGLFIYFCGCVFLLTILCDRPEAIHFCQKLMVPISILLFGLQKFRPVTQFGSFSRQSTPRAASHQPHKAK